MQTDASYRFERGVDPLINKYALGRVLAILTEHTTIEDFSINHISSPKIAKHINNSILVKSNLFESSLGVKISDKFILRTLNYLGFNPKKSKEGFNVTVPSHRFDIGIAQDLVEEVARVYGYNNFKPILAVNSLNNMEDITNKFNGYSDY